MGGAVRADLSNHWLWAATYTYDFYAASKSFHLTHIFSHLWSLAVEEQFYLVWPIAILLTPAHRLKAILLFVMISGPVFRLLIAWMAVHSPISHIFGPMSLVVYVLPLSHVDAFAMGGEGISRCTER
jgi:peptidoglycan/LPS O-acetylase OafA/YrhL